MDERGTTKKTKKTKQVKLAVMVNLCKSAL